MNNITFEDFYRDEHLKAEREYEAIVEGKKTPGYQFNGGEYYSQNLTPIHLNEVLTRYLNEGLRITKLSDPLATTFTFRASNLRETLRRIYGNNDSWLTEERRDSVVKSFMRKMKDNIRNGEGYGEYLYLNADARILTYDLISVALEDAINQIQAAELGNVYEEKEDIRRLIADSDYFLKQLQDLLNKCITNSK